MNKEQESFILHCLVNALSLYAPRKRYEIEGYIFDTFNKLGDE